MSQKIDPREVLSYLNELGYTNISAQQLKEFLTDLKKLMKYEFRHKIEYKENSRPIHSEYNYDSFYSEHHVPSENQESGMDIFNHHYSQATMASKAKEVDKRKKQISVHITKARNKNQIIHDHCVHIENNVVPDSKPRLEQPESKLLLEKPESTEFKELKPEMETDSSTVKSIRPQSNQSISSKPSSKEKSSKRMVIRPSSSKGINRCDPVALYHHYQAEWKKVKFPGQENHSDLRWAVREKLIGGPRVCLPMRGASSRKKISKYS